MGQAQLHSDPNCINPVVVPVYSVALRRVWVWVRVKPYLSLPEMNSAAVRLAKHLRVSSSQGVSLFLLLPS